MITIDVGNSTWSVGHWRDDEVTVRSSAALPDVVRWVAEGQGEIVAISVAPTRLAALCDALPVDVRVLREPRCRLDPPALATTAGADRLAAATAMLPGPGIVVDAGTAVTLDVVDAAGVYRGGYIAPGPAIAAKALSVHAEQLPELPGVRVPLAPGGNTDEAISRGVWGLCVGGVDRLVAEIRATFGHAPVIATGGWGAAWVADTLSRDVTFDSDLVHRGIRHWARLGG